MPSPPIAGLHDSAPMVANRWVRSAVRAPTRAAAAAASQPAWPPPITMTAKFFSIADALAAQMYRRVGAAYKRALFTLPGGEGAECECALSDGAIIRYHL